MLLEQIIFPQINKVIQSFSNMNNVWCLLKEQLFVSLAFVYRSLSTGIVISTVKVPTRIFR